MMTTEQTAAEGRGACRVDWNDPTVPAGDSPPLPGAPLWISTAIWLGWMGFLVLTATTG